MFPRSKSVLGTYMTFQRINQAVNQAHRAWARYLHLNPAAPWFVPVAVPYAQRQMRPGLKALEWG